MMDAMSYEVIDRESGNTVAAFDSESEAVDFLMLCIERNPQDQMVLGVIALSEEGEPLKSFSAQAFVGLSK